MLGKKNTTVLVNVILFLITALQFPVRALEVDISSDVSLHRNTSNDFTLSNFKHLNEAKILKGDLININKIVEALIKQIDDWAHAEIANITDSNLSEFQLKSLEYSVNILQTNITELSLELSKNTNIEDVKRRSVSIQNYLDNLQKEFSNKTKNQFHLLHEYLDGNSVIDKYYNISAEKRNIDIKIEEELEAKFVENCLEAIRKVNFIEAAFHFDLIKSPSKFEHIVKQLSTADAIKLGDKTRNITKSFFVYKSVYNNLNDNIESVDKIHIIANIIKSIRNGIINQEKTTTLIRKEASELINILKHKLKILAESEIAFLINQEFYYVDEVYSDKLSSIMDVINTDYRIASEIIYNLFKNHKYIPDEDLDNYLFIPESFDRTNAFNYALLLKDLLEKCRRESSTLSVDLLCNSIITLSDRLPNMVKQIVFSERICIHGRTDVGMYLRLSNTSYENIKYMAYFHTENYYVPSEVWKLKHVEDNIFTIENVDKNGTYLDIDLHNEVKSGENAVYAWKSPPNKGMWRFSLSKDLNECYIQNMANNEYLYGSKETDYFAYTKSFMNPQTDYYQWRIVNCTNVSFYN